jgi:hypothetical protein
MVEVTILLKVVLGIIALTVLLKAPLRIKRDRLQGCRTGIAPRFGFLHREPIRWRMGMEKE